MLLTDTDNLMYKSETKNVYEDFYKNKELFDISNYSKDSKYYKNANNLVVGKMKDETSGMLVKDYVGLKSKIYTLIAANNHESKKAKGINQNFLDNKLKFENYTNILFNRS